MKVYQYESLDRPSRHCREEVAVEIDGRLVDTFWSLGSESHTLTATERDTAKFVFDTDDYDQIERYPRDAAERVWSQYRPEDRGVISSQHRLQNDYYVRKGSKPDLEVKLENATRAHEKALSALDSARRRVEWARADLDELIASRASSSYPEDVNA